MKPDTIVRAKAHLDKLEKLTETLQSLKTATGMSKWQDINVIHASRHRGQLTDTSYLSSLVNSLGIPHEEVASYLLQGLIADAEKKATAIKAELTKLGVEVD